jgi:hypothetical protein
MPAMTQRESLTPARAWLVGAVLAALLVAGCGGDADESDAAATPTATTGAVSPTPTGGSDATAWADGVCQATTDLETSLDALGSGLQVEVGSGGATDQLREQLRTQVETVRGDTEALGDALTAVPTDADPDTAAAAAQLEQDRAALQQSVAELSTSAGALADAGNAATLAATLADLGADLAAVRVAATSFATSLRALASSSATSVQSAFASAPACAARS